MQAGDGITFPGCAQVPVYGAIVGADGARVARGAGGEMVLVRLAQRRRRAGAGAFRGGYLAGGDLAQRLAGGAPCLFGRYPPVTSDDEAAVGDLASAVTRAVVGDVGAPDPNRPVAVDLRPPGVAHLARARGGEHQ